MYNKLFLTLAISTASIAGATYIINDFQPKAEQSVSLYSAKAISDYYDQLVLLNNKPLDAFYIAVHENNNVDNVKDVSETIIQYEVGNSCIQIELSTKNKIEFFDCLTHTIITV